MGFADRTAGRSVATLLGRRRSNRSRAALGKSIARDLGFMGSAGEVFAGGVGGASRSIVRGENNSRTGCHGKNRILTCPRLIQELTRGGARLLWSVLRQARNEREKAGLSKVWAYGHTVTRPSLPFSETGSRCGLFRDVLDATRGEARWLIW